MRKTFLSTVPAIVLLFGALFVSASPNISIQSTFIENVGQFHDSEANKVKGLRFFLSHDGVDVYFFDKSVSYVFQSNQDSSFVAGHRVDMKWLNSNLQPTVRGSKKLGSHRKYYLPGINGAVANEYEEIIYENVWPGIDVRFSFAGQLKYDYIVHSGADISKIKFEYQGANGTKLDGEGNLVVSHSLGQFEEKAPFTFDALNKVPLGSRYEFNAVEGTFGIYVEGWSNGINDIIIDPTVSWGTFYGGSSNEGNLLLADVDADSQNDIYYVGNSGSSNFPVSVGAFQDTMGGGLDDAVVVKFDKAGNRKWATYMGGSASEAASGVSVGVGDYVYFTGNTNSTDFPTTAGAYQGSFDAITDLIIVKMDSGGNVIWSTYFGASGTDDGNRLAATDDGFLYVVGNTTSPDLPVTTGAFQTTYNNANEVLFSKFDTSGTMIWTTFIGGFQNDFGNGVAVSPDGGIYVTGTSASFDWYTSNGAYQDTLNGSAGDVFLTKFDSAGNNIWSTFIGGTGDDVANGVDCDQFANVIVGGYTQSTNFPTTSNAYQQNDANGINFSGIAAKFSPSGAIIWSTYFNGNTWERFLDVAVGPNNDIYLSGDTRSSNMPTTNDAYQGTFGGGFTDAIVVKLDDTCGLAYSSFLGGNDQDYGRGVGVSHLDGSFFLSGYTVSANFPTIGNVFQSTYGGGANDIFIYRFTDCAPILPVLSTYDTIGYCSGDSLLLDPGTNPSFTYSWSTGSSAPTIYATSPGQYYVTVDDTGACSGTDTVVVVAGTAPTAGITAVGSPTFCDGSSVAMVGTGASSLYHWYMNGNLIAGETGDTLVTSTTGSYTVVADPQLCSDSLSTPIVVTKNPNPTVDLGNDTTICGGSIVTLDAGFEAGATYLWSDASTADTLNVSSTGTYKVVESFATGCADSDSVVITTTTSTVSTYPWNEDFESFSLCSTNNNCSGTNCSLANGFVNYTNGQDDDIDWRTNEGPPPTLGGGFNTGPAVDHNPGTATGNYLYIEGSGNCNWQTATLESPCIDLDTLTSPELRFWHHMWGNNIGTLRLDIWSNGGWTNDVYTRNGDQGNQWDEAIIGLLPYKGQIIRFRIRGNTANGALSDIAIDDFSIANVSTPPVANFGASVTNPCMSDTVVLFDNSQFNVTSWSWSVSPNTFNYVNGTDSTSENPEIVFGATGIYTVTMVGTNLVGSDTVTKTSYIESVNPVGLPLFEDLESFANCGTSSDCGGTDCPLGNGFGNPQNGIVDDMDWRIHEQYTPTNQTGPQSGTDYNPGTVTGHYLYTEASGCSYSEAHLHLPCIDLTGVTAPVLDFWANMRGNAIGELHVDAKVMGVWQTDIMTPISGTQGNPWFNITVPLDSFISQVVTLRIRGVTSGGSQGDICIDDIKVYDDAPPVAAMNVVVGCVGDTTIITDNSSGYATSWTWAFGAGAVPDSATGIGPHKVVYPSSGNYSVTFIASSPYGSDTLVQTINIPAPVSNSVSIALTNGSNPGCAVDMRTFTATPVNGGNAPIYDWYVNDSVYQSGTSNSFMTNQLFDGDTVWCQMFADTNCPAPNPASSNDIVMQLDSVVVADFGIAKMGENANFINASYGGPNSFLWDFGDGTTSTTANPTHWYGTDGSYVVCLIATDTCSSDTTCDTLDIFCQYLGADFSYIGNFKTFSFIDSSAGGSFQNQVFYDWDFGDGIGSSASQNPVYTFPKDSTYWVCLSISDSACTDTFCDSVYVSSVIINSGADLKGVDIYPNPAKDYITIRWNDSGMKPDHIKLTSLLGTTMRFINRDKLGLTEHRFNTEGLSAGVYLVEIERGGARSIGRVVIEK